MFLTVKPMMLGIEYLQEEFFAIVCDEVCVKVWFTVVECFPGYAVDDQGGGDFHQAFFQP